MDGTETRPFSLEEEGGSPKREIRVLIVDDEPGFAEVTGEFIEEENSAISTHILTEASTALEYLEEADIDAIVSDYEMPEIDGLEFLEAVREDYPDLPFLLFTGRGSEDIASEAISAGVTDYLQKDSGSGQYKLLANRVTNAVAQYRARREYQVAQARFYSLTHNAPFAVITIDEDSTIQFANDTVSEVFGYEPAEIEGESLLSLMPDRFRDAHRTAIDRYLRTGDRTLDWSWIELPGLHADGHEVPLGITFGELSDGATHLFSAIIRDITEQKRVEAERRLLFETIRAGAEAETFRDGLEAVIAEVCRATDWVYGEAWVPAAEGTHLDRTGATYTDAEEYTPFEEISAVTTFDPNEGLPGRVWSRKETVWISNVSDLTEEEFPRVEGAREVGLKAAVGAPIIANDQVVAVLAFYMAEERGRDAQAVEIVSTIATELGELMERKQKTDEVREHERELEHQRDELERLNRLNTVIRNIVEAIIEAETREEIEAMVCNRLVAEDPFTFAWIGDVDRMNNRVRSRTAAGAGGDYLDDITITTNGEPTAAGPTGRAIETGDVEVTANIRDEPKYEPWREQATKHGFLSSAAVPIVHEERLYGVLNVYADRTAAFGDAEQDVLAELGRAIGKAMSAIEQRAALVGDQLVEIELLSGELATRYDTATDGQGPVEVTIERIVQSGDDTFQFYTADGIDAERFVDLLEGYSSISHAQVLDDHGDTCRVKATLSGRTMAEVLADNGGRVRRARYEDGDFRITAELPFGADIRQVLAAARSIQDDLELVSQKTVERERPSSGEFQSALEEHLTSRQHAALELAYLSGFFEWPREATGEDVADAMGVAPATFHQHLRSGERKLVEAFFEEDVFPE